MLRRLILRWLAALLLFAATPVFAEESVPICFNYGCAAEQAAVFSEQQLEWLRDIMGIADNPEQERALVSLTVGRLYVWAGEQTPVAADRGGNLADDGQPGSMDCIDHSTTTTRFLRLMERHGALRFHRVLDPAKRGVVFQHLSAQIQEIGPELMHAETEHIQRFAVDSWYVDNGQPAIVLPLDEWKDGGGPDV